MDDESKCRGCGRDLANLNWYQIKKHKDCCLNKNTLEPFLDENQ